MIKRLLVFVSIIVHFCSTAQTTLNTTVQTTQTIEDPIAVVMAPGFKVTATPNLTFNARIGNGGFGSIANNSGCDKYGKIIISEVYFDTRYNENINDKYHHFGEYIELYNSSNVPVNLNGWEIRDNHTRFRMVTGDYNNLIIQPGGYKIITFNGFYGYSHYSQGGAESAIGGRAKFFELFPELNALNFNPDDIILQNTMVFLNDADNVTLLAPSGNVVDRIAYENVNGLYIQSVSSADRHLISSTILDNNDGGVFNGPMGGLPDRDSSGIIIIDPVTHERTYTIHNEFKKAIYRSVLDSYYSNGAPLDFQIATATPGSMPFSIPLKDLDPFLNYNSQNNNNNNYTESFAYDIKSGDIIVHAKTYYNDLGKPTVSLSKDFQTGRVWGTETAYDDFGRKSKASFPATTCLDFDNINYLTDPIMKSVFLDKYYSDNNTLEPYQSAADQTYSQVKYDDILNPGKVINVVGGNKIDDGINPPDWKTGYSYTVPAAQEMYYVYGYNYYNGPITSGKEEVITKFTKSVSVDANGIENVSFTDGEGKLLAVARSKGNTSYPVVSLIGTQGYVDIHIPAGAPAGTLLGNLSNYKVFDLKDGHVIPNSIISVSGLASGSGYRIAVTTPPTTDPKVYIAQTPTGGAISYDAGALGVAYSVNYYDFNVNVYNKIGQLTKNVQPNGYEFNAVIKDTPAHMQSTATDFITTYVYNDQGQIKEVTSPDKGTSKFLYRSDGQIRYSQNTNQADTSVSYTDYDEYARPVESGVLSTFTDDIWSRVSIDPDGPLLAAQRSEQIFTVFDYPTNYSSTILTADQIPTNLELGTLMGSNAGNYMQQNLAGNIAVTYSKDAGVINAISWFSYDKYGRVAWIVQYNEGLGAKTTDYEYDYKGDVKKIVFQKYNATELFVHQYTYDLNSVLTKVETSKDNTNFITQADYTYYISGELKRVNIGQGVQGLDYVYTLDGKLKSINHPSLDPTKDPGHDTNDVFGITLDYNSSDYKRSGSNIVTSSDVLGSNQDFNGQIKAMRWANKDILTTGNQNAYTYTYDRNGWLKEATFGTTNNTGAITSLTRFREGSLNYDANGNITSLQRTNDSGTAIDQLTYNYLGTNKLSNVDDAVPTGTANYDIDDQPQDNYNYTPTGLLAYNASDNLFYSYNTIGHITEVKKGSNPLIRFFYNERGQCIKKEHYKTSSPFTLVSTDYYALDLSGNTMAIYNKPVATAIVQKEVLIYGLSRLGVYTKSTTSAGDIMTYEITDHLGNVRAIAQRQIGNTTIAYFYSDYYPYGEKLPTRDNITGNYRYAYQGQETDGETGMESFKLRLWDGRIGRWLSPDPKGQNVSPYMGMGNNPARMIDPDGGWCYDSVTGKTIPCGEANSAYNNIWNHIGVLQEVSVVSESKTPKNGFFARPMDENSEGGISGFALGWNYRNIRIKENLFNLRISGFNSQFTNRSNEFGPNLVARVSALDGKTEIGAGDKDFHVKGEASGSVGVLEAFYKTQWLDSKATGKYGYKADVGAGASALKGSIKGGFSLLGTTVTWKTGARVLNANLEFHGYFYYDSIKGTIEYSQEAGAGLIGGVLEGNTVSVPIVRYYNSVKSIFD